MSLLPASSDSYAWRKSKDGGSCKEIFMIADIKVPNSDVVRQAEELARSVSNDVLFMQRRTAVVFTLQK